MKSQRFKVRSYYSEGSGSNLQKYRDVFLGGGSLWFLVKYELVMLLASWVPGALGLLLRKLLYPTVLKEVGKGVLFGRNVMLRHPQKITIGRGTVIDEGCLLDAKGGDNRGIAIGEGCFIGRNTAVYCKDGDIVIEDGANIGMNCVLSSLNRLVVGPEVLIAADCYLVSGGGYDYTQGDAKIIDQPGDFTSHPVEVGANSWIGAKAVILDGASVGEGSVIGAGAVVTRPVPARSVAVGSPARVVREIDPG
ncbi:acyltransferase [Candidatus Moduliflexota bacterium]